MVKHECMLVELGSYPADQSSFVSFWAYGVVGGYRLYFASLLDHCAVAEKDGRQTQRTISGRGGRVGHSMAA